MVLVLRESARVGRVWWLRYVAVGFGKGRRERGVGDKVVVW